MSELEYIKDLSWKDVFEIWRRDEESNPQWQTHARSRGFTSWEEWRRSYVPALKLNERSWSLHRVLHPEKTVPTFLGGPFNGWIKNVYGDSGSTPTFMTIAERLSGMKNEKAKSLISNFPEETTVCGVLTKSGIVITEGMHRCSAIALAAAEGKIITKDFFIALGSELSDPLPTSIGGHRKGESPI